MFPIPQIALYFAIVPHNLWCASPNGFTHSLIHSWKKELKGQKDRIRKRVVQWTMLCKGSVVYMRPFDLLFWTLNRSIAVIQWIGQLLWSKTLFSLFDTWQQSWGICLFCKCKNMTTSESDIDNIYNRLVECTCNYLLVALVHAISFIMNYEV